MAEEIQEAIQIIRVAYDGIEIAMKVGSGTLEQMKKALEFLFAVLEREKSMGKTNMRKLLMKGGDLQVFQFDTKELKQVQKMAKKYGILYSLLPDINQRDGKSELIFPTEAIPRVNMMLQKLKAGKIATLDDYLKNGEEKEMGKLLSFLKGQKRGNKKNHTKETEKTEEIIDGLIEKVGWYAMEKASIRVEKVMEDFQITKKQAENVIEKLETMGVLEKKEDGTHKTVKRKEDFLECIQNYQNLAKRIHVIGAAKNPNLVEITVAKKMIEEENDHAMKMRIPSTWGKEARYLWVEKQDLMEIHQGKTLRTFLDKEKEYSLYSAHNEKVGKIKGEQLYQQYYDKTAAFRKERYLHDKENIRKEIKKAVQRR